MLISVEGVDEPWAGSKNERHVGMGFFVMPSARITSRFRVAVGPAVVGFFRIFLVGRGGLLIEVVHGFEEVEPGHTGCPWVIHMSQDIRIVGELFVAGWTLAME